MLGDILSADRVDGVLVIGDLVSDGSRIENMKHLMQMHGNVLTVGAHPSVAGEMSVLVDDERGVSLALDYLLSLGHRSIAYISQSNGSESWEDVQRRAAYERFLSRHSLPIRHEAERTVGNSVASVRVALEETMALAETPTAVFVNNDFTALATVKAALMCGIRVPDDLSIVGFDDIPFAEWCSPELTTVRQPIEAMGRCAVNILLDRIADLDPPVAPAGSVLTGSTLVFAPTLVRRGSACAPPHRALSFQAV